jgi:hypothetical protein
MLAVPEDPARPDGPTVELFVARIGALGAEPRPDPLLLIAGGPGQSTVDFYCLATVLSELAVASGVCMRLDERRVPVKEAVRALCEILGLDPLYLANEGKLVAVVPRTHAQAVVEAMRAHPAGRDAAVVGEVAAAPRAIAVLRTVLGGERMLDMLVGEQLPRIC